MDARGGLARRRSMTTGRCAHGQAHGAQSDGTVALNAGEERERGERKEMEGENGEGIFIGRGEGEGAAGLAAGSRARCDGDGDSDGNAGAAATRGGDAMRAALVAWRD